MSRTIMDMAFRKPFEEVENSIWRILQTNDFFETNYRGDAVWKRYNDCLGTTAVQYLQIEYGENCIHLQAWIGDEKFSGESDLNGFAGIVPKKKLKKIIEEIQNSI